MLFNSMEYMAVLAATLEYYWHCPWLKGRQWVVLTSSLYIYFSWSKAFSLMLIEVIAIHWLITSRITPPRSRARAENLLLLCYSKYMNLFLGCLYITLGGSRTSAARKTLRNLFLSLLAGGLCHGGRWNFISWGINHGGALAVQRLFDKLNPQTCPRKLIDLPGISWLLTITAALVAWIFFRTANTPSAFARTMSVVPGWSQTKIASIFDELLLIYLPIKMADIQNYIPIQHNKPQNPRIYRDLTTPALDSYIYYAGDDDFMYFQS